MPDSGNEKNSNTTDDSPSTATPKYNKARRRLLATLGTGGAIAVAKTLPESWTKPLIDSVILPAHGEASTTTTYSVGDTGPGGGIVFFIENGGTTGLEAMTADQTGTLTYGTKMQHNSASTTDGAANTAAILAAEPSAPAAKACNDLTSGGKSDWYLPADDELITLMGESDTVGGFGVGGYWSSTQHLTNIDYAITKTTNGEVGTKTKTTAFSVRAIRSF